MSTAAILLAAGTGVRLGAELPKAFVDLGGRPMLVHPLAAMNASGVVDRVVLVVPPGAREQLRPMLDDLRRTFGIEAIVEGGATRQESVRLGLAEAGDAAVVLCHDAARPFASARLFRQVVDALPRVDGAIPVVPSPDTVKVLSGGLVERTLPRGSLVLAQTPQAFQAEALRDAHQRASAGADATDDAQLLEEAGYRVGVVQGEPTNFKVTSAADLERARGLLVGRGVDAP